ncbi:MAG: hypothetical protein HYU36_03505 [Planctomycetes bacterium]|nr:hypothetical protein [Planctomycetota bacterium]
MRRLQPASFSFRSAQPLFLAGFFLAAAACLSREQLLAEDGIQWVVVAADEAEVYRDNQVVLRAARDQKFQLVETKGEWVGVSWDDGAGRATGWIAASKVRRASESDAAAERVDVSVWTSPDGRHPSKERLRALFDGACESYGQAAADQAQAAIQLDPHNGLLYYLLANAAADNLQWELVKDALKKGNSRPEAYFYNTASGLDQYLMPLPHLQPLRQLALSVTRQARKMQPDAGAELLRDLRRMAQKLAEAQPPFSIHLQLAMGIVTVVDTALEMLGQKKGLDELVRAARRIKKKDQDWIAEVQQELLLQGSEEIFIARKYLRVTGLSPEAINQFMSFGPALAMEDPTGAAVPKPAREEKPKPKEIAKSAEAKKRNRFYRQVRNYDFLSDMLAEAASQDEESSEKREEPDMMESQSKASGGGVGESPGAAGDPQMLKFFADQEATLLKSLKTPVHKQGILTAKQFLAAAISGSRSPLFERLMNPQTEADRSDRNRWDRACDEGVKEMAGLLARLMEGMPE